MQAVPYEASLIPLPGSRTMRRRLSLLLVCFQTIASQACATRDAASSPNNPAGLRLTSIVAGNMFTCGIDRDRALWCWGGNNFGELGVGDLEDRLLPVRVLHTGPVARVTTGEERVCTVDTASTLRCWGDNVAWALGDSIISRRSIPEILPVGHVRHVAAGSRFTCATDSTGTAYCWGGDRNGELGDGGDTISARMTRDRVASPVAFDTIVAGRLHACGLTADGSAWCWGAAGLSGDGSREKRLVPVLVAGAERFRSLTAGSGVTCGITLNDAAWCWGLGSDGQLGFGAPLDNKFVPVPVAGGHRFRQLAAGYHRVCGLDRGGRAWCWGSNFNGALGDTGRLSSMGPVPVHGSRRYVTIASGDSHACAIDKDGYAWCWGQNGIAGGGGALGDGSIEDRSFPVLVAAPDTSTAAPPPGKGGER